jgi:hypothetical protein
VVTTGTVVAITDGDDTSGATLSSDHPEINRISIGISSDVNDDKLTGVGPDGSFLAPSAADWTEAFSRVARRVAEYHERAYLLGYCSPAAERLARTSALVTSGRLAREQVHRFWRECGADYLEGGLQGRAPAKPFGCAGDFALIDDIYRETVAAKAQNWDRLLLRQSAPRALRNRLAYFSALARSAVARATREPQILSLGCGPSRELFARPRYMAQSARLTPAQYEHVVPREAADWRFGCSHGSPAQAHSHAAAQ